MKQRKHQDPNYIKPVQAKYEIALKMISNMNNRPYSERPNNIELEKEIAYLINKIETYGFEFFPNHYIFDDVVKLQALSKQLYEPQPEKQ